MRKLTILAVLVVSVLVPFITSAAYEISDGSIKALYRLGDTVDSSGNGYNLTNNGSATFGNGKLGDAVTTVRGSKYLNIANAITYGSGGTTAISAWVNFDALPSSGEYYAPVGIADLGSNSYLQIWYWNDSGTRKLQWCRTRGGVANDCVSETVEISTGSWQHLVLNYNGSTVEGFRNNVSKGTVSSSGNGSAGGSSDQFVIGSYADPSHSNGFNGKVDDLAIKDSIFTTTSIAGIYNSGEGNEICITVGCAATEEAGTSTAVFNEQGRDWLAILVTILATIFLGSIILSKP